MLPNNASYYPRLYHGRLRYEQKGVWGVKYRVRKKRRGGMDEGHSSNATKLLGIPRLAFVHSVRKPTAKSELVYKSSVGAWEESGWGKGGSGRKGREEGLWPSRHIPWQVTNGAFPLLSRLFLLILSCHLIHEKLQPRYLFSLHAWTKTINPDAFWYKITKAHFTRSRRSLILESRRL